MGFPFHCKALAQLHYLLKLQVASSHGHLMSDEAEVLSHFGWATSESHPVKKESSRHQ